MLEESFNFYKWASPWITSNMVSCSIEQWKRKRTEKLAPWKPCNWGHTWFFFSYFATFLTFYCKEAERKSNLYLLFHTTNFRRQIQKPCQKLAVIFHETCSIKLTRGACRDGMLGQSVVCIIRSTYCSKVIFQLFGSLKVSHALSNIIFSFQMKKFMWHSLSCRVPLELNSWEKSL